LATTSDADEMVYRNALSRMEIVCFESVRSVFYNRRRGRSRNGASVLLAAAFARGAFWERGKPTGGGV
jgi:hypothetical protein